MRKRGREVWTLRRRGLTVGLVICIFGALSFLFFRGVGEERKDDLSEIHVEVLNGCGEQGIARKVGRFLRLRGFDVISEGNAQSFDFIESIVVDRAGLLSNAEKVAKALGIKNCVQQIKADPFRIEEVTVIIGRDYDRLKLE